MLNAFLLSFILKAIVEPQLLELLLGGGGALIKYKTIKGAELDSEEIVYHDFVCA